MNAHRTGGLALLALFAAMLISAPAAAGAESVDSLIRRLRSWDEKHPEIVAKQLAKHKGPDLTRRLVTEIADEGMAPLRANLCSVFPEMGPEAIGELVKCITGDLKPTKKLRRYAPSDDTPDREKFAFAAADAMVWFGKDAVEPLTTLLKNGDAISRRAAADAFYFMREPASVPALATALYDEDAKVRDYAVHALGRIPGDASIDALKGAYDRPDYPLRPLVALQVGRLKAPGALDYLLFALKCGDHQIMSEAIPAIGALKDPRAVDGLVAVIEAPEDKKRYDRDLRVASVAALGEIRDRRAVGPLVALSDKRTDWDKPIADEAVTSLGRIGDVTAEKALLSLLEADLARRDKALATTQRIDKVRHDPGGKRRYATGDDGRENLPEEETYEAAMRVLYSDSAAKLMVALEKLGTPDAREAVDRAMAKGAIYDYRPEPVKADLAQVARDHKAILAKIHSRERPSIIIMTLALERYGTPEMAADYIASEDEAFVLPAAEWAERHGAKDAVKALLPTEKLKDFVDHPEKSRLPMFV